MGIGSPADDGQVQLQGLLDLLLLALSDIGSEGFRRTLHRFGGHLQAGQNFHLFAAVIEGGLLAHQRLHAAHPGREFRVLDVQFDIGGKLAGVTVRAPIVGTGDFHRVPRRSARAWCVVGGRGRVGRKGKARCAARRGRGELEQLRQGRGARPVQGRAHRHLRRFQVEAPALAPILENHP